MNNLLNFKADFYYKTFEAEFKNGIIISGKFENEEGLIYPTVELVEVIGGNYNEEDIEPTEEQLAEIKSWLEYQLGPKNMPYEK